jgi:hypothetical protein
MSINDQNGTKKKIKNDKNISERKKRTKTKKKHHEQLNTNNNNSATMIEDSLTSFTNENGLILPQIGISSQTEIDETKYIRGPKHQIFNRRRQKSIVNLEKTF